MAMRSIAPRDVSDLSPADNKQLRELVSFNDAHFRIMCVDSSIKKVALKRRGRNPSRIRSVRVDEDRFAVFSLEEIARMGGAFDVELTRSDGLKSRFGRTVSHLVKSDSQRKLAVHEYVLADGRVMYLAAYFTLSRASLSIIVASSEAQLEQFIFGLHTATLDYAGIEGSKLTLRGHFLVTGVNSSECSVSVVLNVAGIDDHIVAQTDPMDRPDLQDKFGKGTNHDYSRSGFSTEIDLDDLADFNMINGRRVRIIIRIAHGETIYEKRAFNLPKQVGSLRGIVKGCVGVYLEQHERSGFLYIAYERKHVIDFAQATRISTPSRNFALVEGAIAIFGVPAAALDVTLVAKQRNGSEEYRVPVKVKPSIDVSRKLYCANGSLQGGLFTARIDVRELSLLLLRSDRFADLFLEVRFFQSLLRCKLTVGATNFQKSLGEDVLGFANILPKSDVLLYLTRKAAACFSVRERLREDGKWYGAKEWLALAFNSFLPSPKKSIWVTYETYSSTAQDNSFYFFEWVVKNAPGQAIYYIIKKNSPDMAALRPYGRRIVHYYSMRHLLLMLRCSLFVAAQGRFHAFKFRPRKSRVKTEVMAKPLVFLQHGVTAFKKSAFRKGDPSGSADLVIAVSDAEKARIVKHWGYKPEDVVVSGFSRFDILEDRSTPDDPMILVMPTWRSWLEDVTQEVFDASEFAKNYHNLLRYLDVRGLRTEFYIHIKLAPYVRGWTEDFQGVKIVLLGEARVNEMLMRASILVTDYSSVAWDFLYMNKPTAFFQFDRSKYERLTGSFIDLEKDLFGPRAENAIDIIKVVDELLAKNTKSPNDQHFRYVDQQNSLRIYREVLRKFGVQGVTD